MSTNLSSFLSKARHSVLNATTPSRNFPINTFVLGNPSADLDSFVSAVLYASFTSRSSSYRGPKRLVIPLLNLPNVPATDLWRLRPEFGTALRLAASANGQVLTHEKDDPKRDEELLRTLITIADTRAPTASTFSRSLFPHNQARDLQAVDLEKFPLVLVDHNTLSIPTIDDPASLPFEVTGCIDHHVDESYTPASADPRIIRTGIGSCTSLIVEHLREAGLWSLSHTDGDSELAKLALSAILIDTANLTAEGKVSDTDREAVRFLEEAITASGSESKWDRASFYAMLSASKTSSLDRLTLREVFERDYKEWTEDSSNKGKKTRIGISSIVKPITWLVAKAADGDQGSGVSALKQAIHQFSHDKTLDVFAIMTASTSGSSGDFQRELLILAAEGAKDILAAFEKESGDLKLEQWQEDRGLCDLVGEDIGIWWQKNVGVSRKGVAPLLRKCVGEV